MSTPVWCVRPEDGLAHARKEIVKRGVTKLVVVDEASRPVGILTVTDLLGSAGVTGRPERRAYFASKTVGDVMTKRVFEVSPDATVPSVAEEMGRRGLGAVPVVAGGELVGILTAGDVLPEIEDALRGRTQVKDVMDREFATVHRHDSLGHVLAKVADSPSRAAIVTDSTSGRSLTGLVTRESLALGEPFEPRPSAARFRHEKRVKEARRREPSGRRDARHVEVVHGVAEDLMVTDVPTLRPEMSGDAAARLLLHEEARVLPVVEDDAVVGLLTRRHLVEAFSRDMGPA